MRSLNKLSVVVPCYNEEEVLLSTHQRLTDVLERLLTSSSCSSYEIIYIDDGSKDSTADILRSIFLEDRNVRVVVLRRNFGLQGALSAGLFLAEGDAVVTIDADLQDPPESIADMIGWYEKGYDLVLGVREDRQTDTFFKRCTADIFYGLMRLLGAEIVPHHGEFRLMARSLVNEFNTLTDRSRFIRSMVLSLESRYAKVLYKRQERTLGHTKFTFFRMFSLSTDAIISNTFIPLRFISIVGGALLFGSIMMAGVVFVSFMRGLASPLWIMNMLPMSIFAGLQMLSLGVIGEYIARLYAEVRQRPVFVVREEFRRD